MPCGEHPFDGENILNKNKNKNKESWGMCPICNYPGPESDPHVRTHNRFSRESYEDACARAGSYANKWIVILNYTPPITLTLSRGLGSVRKITESTLIMNLDMKIPSAVFVGLM